jgi:hypothetical protein
MPRTTLRDYPKVNDWTLKKEKLLKYWQEECRLYKWLYTQNVEYYQSINRQLSIFGILLSVITGATLINNSNDTAGVNPHLVLAFGLVSVLSSFTQGLRQFLDLESKISANLLSSRQNSAIVIDIEEQINLAQEERINGNEFIKNIKARKNEIIQNAPIITRSRWAQLQKKIQRGEGVNFFNETIFKNYLETTVEIGELKLETTPAYYEQKQESPQDDMALQDSITPQDDGIKPQMRTRVASPQHSHSEDELIEELQCENLGVQQLRTAFSNTKTSPGRSMSFKPNSSSLSAVVTDNSISQEQQKRINTHKHDALLKYHMSRL